MWGGHVGSTRAGWADEATCCVCTNSGAGWGWPEEPAEGGVGTRRRGREPRASGLKLPDLSAREIIGKSLAEFARNTSTLGLGLKRHHTGSSKHHRSAKPSAGHPGPAQGEPCSLSYLAPPLHKTALATLSTHQPTLPPPGIPAWNLCAALLSVSLSYLSLPTLWPQKANFRLPRTDFRKGVRSWWSQGSGTQNCCRGHVSKPQGWAGAETLASHADD